MLKSGLKQVKYSKKLIMEGSWPQRNSVSMVDMECWNICFFVCQCIVVSWCWGYFKICFSSHCVCVSPVFSTVISFGDLYMMFKLTKCDCFRVTLELQAAWWSISNWDTLLEHWIKNCSVKRLWNDNSDECMLLMGSSSDYICMNFKGEPQQRSLSLIWMHLCHYD